MADRYGHLSGNSVGPIQVMLLQRISKNPIRRSTRFLAARADLLPSSWCSIFDRNERSFNLINSTAALQSASAEMQVELLRSLGRLSVIDYYIVAKNKRSVIVETALSSLNDPLGDEDVIWIGNAVLDFQPQHLQRLSFRAFQSALPILQVKQLSNNWT